MVGDTVASKYKIQGKLGEIARERIGILAIKNVIVEKIL